MAHAPDGQNVQYSVSAFSLFIVCAQYLYYCELYSTDNVYLSKSTELCTFS